MNELDLLDWRRRIFELYRQVRHQSVTDPKAAWSLWRSTRDELFRTHPQSPLPRSQRKDFEGVPYFDYDPRYRLEVKVYPSEPERFEIPTSGTGPMAFSRVGSVAFRLGDHDASLDVYWLEAYAGGLFVPFKDATSGHETYGACRYLLDTVKGADLGGHGDTLVLDFNFAYNPSCSYDARWVCPLAPPPNHLSIEVRAGEKLLDKA